MLRLSAIVILTSLSFGCASQRPANPPAAEERAAKQAIAVTVTPPLSRAPACDEAAALEQWLRFIGRIESLDPQALAGERDRVLVEYRQQPTDGNRLALGYLLSRTHVFVHDAKKSQALLSEIDPTGPYAVVRDLLRRQLATVDTVADLQEQITHLQSQLDALKIIETDLSDNQKEFEGVRQ